MKEKILYLLIAIFIVTNIITFYYLIKSNSNLEEASEKIQFHNKIHETPFVNDKIKIADNEISINENQKYYLFSGDCSGIVKNDVNFEKLISYELKETFNGTIEMIVKEEETYYNIYLTTNLRNIDYSNEKFVTSDSSGFSKDVYATIYNFNLVCEN